LDFHLPSVRAALEKLNIDFDLAPEQTANSINGQYIRNEEGNPFGVFVNLCGQRSRLEQAILYVIISPGTDEQNRQEIFGFMEAMLSSAIPNWDEGKSWLESSLGRIMTDRQIELIQDDYSIGLERLLYEVPTMDATAYTLLIQIMSADERSMGKRTPEPTPTAQPGWANYSDSDISFSFPVDWIKIDSTYDPKCQMVACLLDIKKPSDKAQILFFRTVLESSDTTSIDLDETLWSARWRTFLDYGLEHELVLESRREIVVDGRSAIERTFTEPDVTDPTSNELAYVINIIFRHGPYSYLLLLSATTKENREINRQIVDQIVESIRLTYLLLEY
jgi:hypothetical protein